MRVRIIRKLADWLDGIDLRHGDVGDVIDLPERPARVVIAEGWAVPARRVADPLMGQPDVEGTSVGRSFGQDRRSEPPGDVVDGDVYQRLQEKYDDIEGERRRFRRRSTDPLTSHAA